MVPVIKAVKRRIFRVHADVFTFGRARNGEQQRGVVVRFVYCLLPEREGFLRGGLSHLGLYYITFEGASGNRGNWIASDAMGSRYDKGVMCRRKRSLIPREVID